MLTGRFAYSAPGSFLHCRPASGPGHAVVLPCLLAQKHVHDPTPAFFLGLRVLEPLHFPICPNIQRVKKKEHLCMHK